MLNACDWLLVRIGTKISTASRRRTRLSRGPRIESLEERQVLASGGVLTPAITGTVFRDLNGDSMSSVGEGLTGALVRLFVDDGDQVFEPGTGDAQAGTGQTTDASGVYCFEGLSATASYWVFQPSQTVGAVTLDQQVSSLVTPGRPGILIDDFATKQIVEAIPPPTPKTASSTIALINENEVIGRERDLIVNLLLGDAEISMEVNPFGSRASLRYNADVLGFGTGTVIWDGEDANATGLALGLNGRDLTGGGANTGIMLMMGAEKSGSTGRLRLFSGSPTTFSETSFAIPTTIAGGANVYQFLPFAGFTGPAQATGVDAIELFLNSATVAANDIELDLIGANGPKVANFLNEVEVDLSITKTSQAEVTPGSSLSYTITVRNNSPVNVTDARVVDTFPATLTRVTYSSTVTGTVSGNTASGSGSINDTVNISNGGSIVYTVTGTVISSARDMISNTATVSPPAGIVDMNPNNNSATATDTLRRRADLRVTKTDNQSAVNPGDNLTYSIIVRNDGPSDVGGATVSDTFPGSLTGVTFTSTASAGAAGNTLSGAGNINDTVNMIAGSSITYMVRAAVAATATGTIANTATVTAPNNVSESNTGNNSATDADTVTVILRAISGFVYVDLDQDGQRDSSEPPISQVAITLQGTDNTGSSVSRSVTTDFTGLYEFENLRPGTYTVRESQPAGFLDGRESIGTGATINPTVADDIFSGLGLGSVQDAVNFNFGEFRLRISKRDLLASSFGG